MAEFSAETGQQTHGMTCSSSKNVCQEIIKTSIHVKEDDLYLAGLADREDT